MGFVSAYVLEYGRVDCVEGGRTRVWKNGICRAYVLEYGRVDCVDTLDHDRLV
jgi:hypothetical protein